MQSSTVILPNWDVPSQVKAFTTTVAGGVSQGEFSSFNLGVHVGDNPQYVAKNRENLQQLVGEDVQLCWLNQTHSDIVVDLQNYTDVVEADAAFTQKQQQACVVMTADCLPVLLCNQTGTKISALHCGWKGLHQNLIMKTIQQYFQGDEVVAWLGPAIGQQSYEVDETVYQRFLSANKSYQSAFVANRAGHYLFDLKEIARQQLVDCGVATQRIFGGEFDTFSDERFFSYRRSAKTGRMATLIYIVK